MAESIDRIIRQLARGCCEYCRFPENASLLPHVLDHVIARQHGGKTEFENLALCCSRCNQHKGPNIAGLDPETEALTRLFHPRRDIWNEHFQYNGAVQVGFTSVGRTTVQVLSINLPIRVVARAALISTGKM